MQTLFIAQLVAFENFVYMRKTSKLFRRTMELKPVENKKFERLFVLIVNNYIIG